MIEGMFGIHNGSWMTSLNDLLDAVKEYDYDLGEAIEKYIETETVPWDNEWESRIYELDEENYELDEENAELKNRYDDLELKYNDLKTKHEELEKENEKYRELEEEYKELKLQLNQMSGFHFLFESEEG